MYVNVLNSSDPRPDDGCFVSQENPRFVSLLWIKKSGPFLHPCKTRRSIFGYFSRRCYVSFLKLSFAGLVRLCQDYQAWCTGDSSAGYAVFRKDQLNSEFPFFDPPVLGY